MVSGEMLNFGSGGDDRTATRVFRLEVYLLNRGSIIGHSVWKPKEGSNCENYKHFGIFSEQKTNLGRPSTFSTNIRKNVLSKRDPFCVCETLSKINCELFKKGVMGESKTKTGSITGDSKLKMGVNAGGRTCLPKFKFSAKFPIGLHVILHLQIKKLKFALHRIMKIILSEKPLELNIELLLK